MKRDSASSLAERHLVFSTKGPEHHFFGYYDKSPLDRSTTRLLCLRVDFAGRLPEEEDAAEIGFWTLADGGYHKLAKTRAFNWQQGCMLQWLGPDFGRYIIFNDRRDGHFVSVILDTETRESEIIPFPVYAVHPSGGRALSVDFERLYFPRRNYAYAGIVRPEKDSDVVDGDGIFAVDFKTKSVERIISTRQLCDTNPVDSMNDGPNYVEHIMLNPPGTRFTFHHRWETADGGVYTRVYAADFDGGERRCLLDSGKATHCCWRGDRQLIVWGAPSNAGYRLRRHRRFAKLVLKPLLPIYHSVIGAQSKVARMVTGTSYLLLEDSDTRTWQRLAQGVLTVDGHPSCNPADPGWLLTDTYPDDAGMQWLILYNDAMSRRIDLGAFSCPPGFSEPPYNCDLHPRWDHTGRYVCIDSAQDGSRQMYLFDVAGLLAR